MRAAVIIAVAAVDCLRVRQKRLGLFKRNGITQRATNWSGYDFAGSC